jgi:hypothetical protein
MNIFKEITSSLQSNRRVFERPIRLDLDQLSQTKSAKLRSMMIELDQFCDNIIAKNQEIYSENQILKESIENYKEKYRHIVKMNSQLGQKINQEILMNSSSNLVIESIMRIFESNNQELTEIRKFIRKKFENSKKKKKKPKEEEKPKETEKEDDEEQIKEKKEEIEEQKSEESDKEEGSKALEVIVNAIKKLVISVDKLYISKPFSERFLIYKLYLMWRMKAFLTNIS